MTKLKLFAAALAMSASFAGSAIAADIYEPGSMKDAPMLAPPEMHDWTGFYLGAGGGLGFIKYNGGTSGTFDVDTTTPPGADAFAFPLDNDEGGFFGTAQLGYDRQFASQFLIGVFADYDFNNDMGTKFETFAALHVPGDPVILYNVWDVGSALAVVGGGAPEQGRGVDAAGNGRVHAVPHRAGRALWAVGLAVGRAAGAAADADPRLADLERGQLLLTCLRRSELLTCPTGRHKTKYQCLAVSELDNLIPPGNYCRFRYRGDRAKLLQSHNERCLQSS